MRHRYSLNLYSEDPFDAEISDYLTMYSRGRKQELLRTLIRVGYSTLVKHKSTNGAMADGFSNEDLVVMVSALVGSGLAAGIVSRGSPIEVDTQNAPYQQEGRAGQDAPRAPHKIAESSQSNNKINRNPQEQVFLKDPSPIIYDESELNLEDTENIDPFDLLASLPEE